jgi:hypothetical protein
LWFAVEAPVSETADSLLLDVNKRVNSNKKIFFIIEQPLGLAACSTMAERLGECFGWFLGL